ncbi:MAG TPA: hypothetical protein VGH70_00490 [Bradyrhizobium sp.]
MGCLAAERASAQATNLEAGKTPAQIFAGTCNACHKAPRGLLKSVPASSLSSFLRQHYTTSPEMAGVLASYLISNGATDTRLSGGDKKGAKEGTREGTKEGTREAKQEAKPPEQLDRWGHRIHPGGAPPPEAAPVSSGEAPQSPSQATIEAAREQNAKQKLSKRNKPGEELPKDEGKGEGVKEASTPGESAKPEGSKPSEAPSQSANAAPSTPGETPALRPDPVPPVTPAPAAGSEPAPAAAPSPPSSVISAAISAETAPAVPSPSKPVESPPAVAAATQALPPVPPAGPPAPPISR